MCSYKKDNLSFLLNQCRLKSSLRKAAIRLSLIFGKIDSIMNINKHTEASININKHTRHL